ncbi:MAG: hypothetical protein REI64_01200 [Pedobacter sp.]|uniref:hypothetical protein n=1 Tax=Pedobacter sp. TaxID=1411316 RepID=UPI00280905A3|nr:hypothetical protein [Pedobacter sp.]MDQ8003381.1 hypothetical protein [Pedobacter sp.]
MKKYIYIISLGLALLACTKSSTAPEIEGDRACGKNSSGQQLYIGPKGGCFYNNSNGNKIYVERSECKCD